MEYYQFPDVIELNVGGRQMTTLLSTLTKEPDSMLAAMFSGRQVINKDKDGRYFIDCDPTIFEHILNYLRLGTVPPKEKILECYDLAEYLNIQSLIERLEVYHDLQYRKRIKELKSTLYLKEFERLKRAAIDMFYTINARPGDNKIIHLFSFENINCDCLCNEFVFLEKCHCPHDHLIKSEIYLKTKGTVSEDLKLCLAHDLCDLGFGKYSDFGKSYQNVVCKRCRVTMSMQVDCHHIKFYKS